MQSGGRAAWPCGYRGLSAVTALAVALAQNHPGWMPTTEELGHNCGHSGDYKFTRNRPAV